MVPRLLTPSIQLRVWMRRRLACVLALLAASMGCEASGAEDVEAAVTAQVRGVLSNALLATEPGRPRVQLLSAQLQGEQLALNFSRELVAFGPGSPGFEAFIRPIHRAAAAALAPHVERMEIITLVEGVRLEALLPQLDAPARAAANTGIHPTTPGRQSLATRRIVVSPGHGYYFNNNNWVLQRAFWNGIVEDFVNHDIVTHLQAELVALGADVRSTRNMNRAAGTGESGFPRWQEAARYHVKSLGAEESVWNEPGFTHLEQDIRCRPRYANAINADVLVSIHNNGAGTPGAGTGTETLYDTSNASALESRRLADLLHARVIAAIRRDYNPAWPDRRVQGFNGSYGENRLATRPSVLIEVAFMDRPIPDNAALQDDRFKRLVAAAIREGLQEYFAEPMRPEAPEAVQAIAGFGTVGLAWQNRGGQTSFRIERRTGGAGAWEVIGTTLGNGGTFLDSSVTAGALYTYRIVAVNAVGESNAVQSGSVTAVAVNAGSASRLSNVSVRTSLATGQRVIVGLVVAGGSREIVLRGIGPALQALGVSAAMSNPALQLFNGTTVAAENDDWPVQLASRFTGLGAFPLEPGSRDAALVHTLQGAHTVQIGGPSAGVVLAEGYDTGQGTGRLINLSCRNRVGTGADIMIAGFHVSGTGVKRLLIRAVGPGLSPFGVTNVLADPKLEIYDARGIQIAANDTWDRELTARFASVVAFPLPGSSRDAALVIALEAGASYTAQVAGVGGATGEALVEIYELPD